MSDESLVVTGVSGCRAEDHEGVMGLAVEAGFSNGQYIWFRISIGDSAEQVVATLRDTIEFIERGLADE